MFKGTAGRGVVDSFLNWLLGDKDHLDVTDWNGWLSGQVEGDETVEEKKKEFYLYLEGHLAKARFEAVVRRWRAELKVLILELDGQPISSEEQGQKAEKIIKDHISEDDQQLLVARVLANFGIGEVKNMAIVSEDFARNYTRFLGLQADLYQQPSQERRT